MGVSLSNSVKHGLNKGQVVRGRRVENNVTNGDLICNGADVESANHSLDTQLFEIRDS